MIRAFRKLDNGETLPIGYQRVNCHMIFDIKMEDFHIKAMLVAGGHVTETPSNITYESVLYWETARIDFPLAALNDLSVKVSDIQNSYTTSPVPENICTVPGRDFGEDSGKKAILLRPLYGLEIYIAAFWNHLADYMHNLVFLPCPSDLYLWMKPTVRPGDWFNHHIYVLIYVDDLMVIHHDAESILRRIYYYFKLNPISIGDPDIYLGAKLNIMRFENRV